MPDLAEHAQAFVNGKKSEWANLVPIAIALRPKQIDRAAERLAKLAGIGKPTVKRKLEAIRFKAAQGWDAERIIVEGQAPTLASYVQGKTKARTLPLVSFPHRLTRPVRDALHENCLRLAKLFHFKTWDEVFEYVNARIEMDSDFEHLHAAGMLDRTHAQNNGHKAG